MFRSMKKAMALGAIVAVGVVAAPAMAAASGQWTTGGSVFSGSMSAQAHGSLTVAPAGSAVRITCDVTLDLTLSNGAPAPTNGHVTVNGVTFANCVTNMPGCAIAWTAGGPGSTLPWTGTGDALTQTVDVGGVHLASTFGAGCPSGLTGGTFIWDGFLSPAFDDANQLLRFDGTGATGTLTSAGNAHVDGELSVTTPDPLGLI